MIDRRLLSKQPSTKQLEAYVAWSIFEQQQLSLAGENNA
jgi:hypothetical protein